MPQFVAHEEVRANRKQRDLPEGHHAWKTDFLMPAEGQDAPTAFIAESTPKRLLRTHYHEVDQFQVIVKGGGVLGKHKLAVHGVHFSRAFTPYGPIVNGEEGIAFMTLRAHRDWGRAQFLPGAREKLEQIIDREPWQVTELPEFVNTGDANLKPFSQIKDERGLAAFSLTAKPHVALAAPDPSNSDGQYIIVTKGGLVYEGRTYNAISIAFVTPEEGPLQLVAGPQGLEALVLNYPRREPVTAKAPPASKSASYRVWQCALCAFSYDEAKGMPEEGVGAGTRWEDVPETWSCPDCSASKSDFQMSVVG